MTLHKTGITCCKECPAFVETWDRGVNDTREGVGRNSGDFYRCNMGAKSPHYTGFNPKEKQDDCPIRHTEFDV